MKIEVWFDYRRARLMLTKISRWRQDSRDLQSIIDARKISRQAALNALAWVMVEREANRR